MKYMEQLRREIANLTEYLDDLNRHLTKNLIPMMQRVQRRHANKPTTQNLRRLRLCTRVVEECREDIAKVIRRRDELTHELDTFHLPK